MGESEANDDFYETYEDCLDDDEISPKEEAFMKGFTARARESGQEEDIEIEMEDINVEFEREEASEEEAEELEATA